MISVAGKPLAMRIGFGARPLSGPSVWPARPEHAIRVLRRAVELGVTFFDTANIYGAGISEMQLAQALYPYRDVIVATKGGMVPREPNGALGIDCNPRRLVQACEQSLERLAVDCLDLYQLHVPDPKIPWAEQVGGLQALRDAGKTRHVGLCNVTVAQLSEAMHIVPIASVQNHYSVSSPASADVVRFCESHGIIFIAHRPFDVGKMNFIALAGVAERNSLNVHQIALAWLMQQSPELIAIPGTTSLSHLEENVAAADVQLTRQELAELSTVS